MEPDNGYLKNCPNLRAYCCDRVRLALEGRLKPVIGRKPEIERVIRVLGRRETPHALLVGEPGVGKTAIVDGLALRIAKGDVPDSIRNMRVLLLDLALLQAGTTLRGMFEERLKGVILEAQKLGNIILVIDEVHNLLGAGSALGTPMDAANILKPELVNGGFQCIGATTFDDYRRHIERDRSLKRRFHVIKVEPPSIDDAIEILRGLRPSFAEFHCVEIKDEAITAAVVLSARYMSDSQLPDKAIDLLDESATTVKQNRGVQSVAKSGLFSLPAVGVEDIVKAVNSLTGIAVAYHASDLDQLVNMEGLLQARVAGQGQAISMVCKAVRRARAGLSNPNLPIGSFLFVGPTGVGKTELAKGLAHILFGSESALIRFDMSEFMERHAAMRLIGAPPSFVGFEEGGELTEAVKRSPYSVLLFDEIEKAHPDVFNYFLQIMQEGELTGGSGRKTDFKNTLLIFTSNVGSGTSSASRVGGFASTATVAGEQQEKYSAAIKATFKPEFIGRLSSQCIFNGLSKDTTRQIVEILFGQLNKRLAESHGPARGVLVDIDDSAKELLAKIGYSSEYGARFMLRTIESYIEDPLADQVIAGLIKPGDHVFITVKDGKFDFHLPERSTSTDALSQPQDDQVLPPTQ
jgi:ATP-dependent Clp protease ATP-binding subunit ClpC